MSGLLSAYWRGDRASVAWLYTAGAAAFATLSSHFAIESGLQWASVMGDLAAFASTGLTPPYNVPDNSALKAKLLGDFLDWATVNGYLLATALAGHYTNVSLHRDWRKWLDGKATDALLGNRGTLMHLIQGGDRNIDNIAQRKSDCIKDATGASIGLVIGAVSTITGAFFAGKKLFYMNDPVRGFEFLGQYGTLTLAFGAVAAAVPIGTYMALKIGKKITHINSEMQKTEASYRQYMDDTVRKAPLTAASNGHNVLKKVNYGLYDDVEKTWGRYNLVHTGFRAFKGIYNPFSSNFITYLPGLPNLMASASTFTQFMGVTGVVGTLINKSEWLIDVMPDIANLKANCNRVTDLFKAVAKVDDLRAHYNKNGITDIEYVNQDKVFGLRLRDLEMMHEGKQEPFLHARQLRLRPGKWAVLAGESGSGKSCLMKAIAGEFQWPYGRGKIICSEDNKIFYAPKKIELENISLRELIAYPQLECSDREVRLVMDAVGLDEFIPSIHEEKVGDRTWDSVLSSGQKQKVIIARAILTNPDLILLDEAFSDLDPDSKVKAHEILKTQCPDAMVLSIMHDSVLPKSKTGEPYYSTVFHIEDKELVTKAPYKYEMDIKQKADKEAVEIASMYLSRTNNFIGPTVALH